MAWTGADVVRELVAGVDAHLPFRRPLPIGFAADGARLEEDVAGAVAELRRWLDSVDPAEVAAGLARRFWSSRPAVLAGHLSQLGLVDRIDDDTTVRRRPAAVCHLVVTGAELQVVLGDRTLRMPAGVEPLVRRVAEGPPLLVGDLAPSADEESRLVLVRRLVREGLLEVVRPGP